MHARRAPRLQKCGPEQGGEYCRLTPLSTSLTAKGLRVLGAVWQRAWDENGVCSSKGLNAIKIANPGLTGALLPLTGLGPAHEDAPSRVLRRGQALLQGCAGSCAGWCLQGSGVAPRTVSRPHNHPHLVTQASELTKWLKYWRRLANLSGLVGTSRFPYFHWAWWCSTDLPLSTRG